MKIIRYSVIAVVSLVVVWWLISSLVGMFAWRVVFLDDGQIFFGKFINIPLASTVTVHRAYYVKSLPTSTSTQYQIAKIESDFHGPTDSINIFKSHIKYYEQLRAGTPIVKGLETQEKQR